MLIDLAEEPSALANWEDEGGPPAVEPRPLPGLDWSAFSARRFPEARRHDIEPIKAYEAYLKRGPAI